MGESFLLIITLRPLPTQVADIQEVKLESMRGLFIIFGIFAGLAILVGLVQRLTAIVLVPKGSGQSDSEILRMILETV